MRRNKPCSCSFKGPPSTAEAARLHGGERTLHSKGANNTLPDPITPVYLLRPLTLKAPKAITLSP